MENATWLILLIATITALIWYYERRTVQLELALDSALDELEKRDTAKHLDHEPPFNLRDHTAKRCGAKAGGLTCTLPPHDTDRHLDENASSIWSSATFTRAEVDAWN